MAVVALASWAAKQGNGFATDEITGAITGIGDYRRALVQAAAAGLGIVIALLLSCIDYRSLVKVWPVHVALTWGLVLPTLFIRNVAIGPLTIGFNAGDTDNYSWYKLGGFTFQPTELAKISFITKYFFWGKRLNDKDTDDRKCRASEPLCAGTDGRGNRPAISSVMQGTGSRASVHGNDQCKGAPV